MNKAVQVGDLKVEPGTTGFGYLKVSQRPVGEIRLPLTVINGSESGPTFSLTAAVHGAEYNGVYTLMRLGKEIDPKEVRGTVIMVPVANVPSFETRTPFFNPIDGQNLNRVFPGKKNGSSSEQIAYTLYNEVICRGNAYIDLHSGDLYEIIPLHTCCQRVANAPLDEMSEKLARAFKCEWLNIMGVGIDDLTASEDEQGTYFAGLQSGVTSVGNAARAGVPAVMIEAGGGGVLDQSVVDMEVEGILNCMRILGMLEGKPNDKIEHKVCYGMYILKSKFGGMYIPDVVPGSQVKKGDSLGVMKNIRGDVVATFTAPMTGVVLMMFTTPVRSSGETILILGKTED